MSFPLGIVHEYKWMKKWIFHLIICNEREKEREYSTILIKWKERKTVWQIGKVKLRTNLGKLFSLHINGSECTSDSKLPLDKVKKCVKVFVHSSLISPCISNAFASHAYSSQAIRGLNYSTGIQFLLKIKKNK